MPPPTSFGYVTPPEFEHAIASAQLAARRAAHLCAEAVRVRLEIQETIAAARSARKCARSVGKTGPGPPVHLLQHPLPPKGRPCYTRDTTSDNPQPYVGPERRRFDRSMLLSDVDVRLLVLAERGYTYRPADAADGVFDVLVDHLCSLRDRSLLRLDDDGIMKSQKGGYLMAGPCDLTDAGRGALDQDRRIGPRP